MNLSFFDFTFERFFLFFIFFFFLSIMQKTRLKTVQLLTTMTTTTKKNLRKVRIISASLTPQKFFCRTSIENFWAITVAGDTMQRDGVKKVHKSYWTFFMSQAMLVFRFTRKSLWNVRAWCCRARWKTRETLNQHDSTGCEVTRLLKTSWRQNGLLILLDYIAEIISHVTLLTTVETAHGQQLTSTFKWHQHSSANCHRTPAFCILSQILYFRAELNVYQSAPCSGSAMGKKLQMPTKDISSKIRLCLLIHRRETLKAFYRNWWVCAFSLSDKCFVVDNVVTRSFGRWI